MKTIVRDASQLDQSEETKYNDLLVNGCTIIQVNS